MLELNKSELPIGTLPRWDVILADDIDALEGIPRNSAEKERVRDVSLSEAFRLATKNKGFLQFILACICVAICYPMGAIIRLVRYATK